MTARAELLGGIAGRIYAIADVEALQPVLLPAAVQELAEAGIRWIQIRAKKLAGRELFQQVEACCRNLEGSGVHLWVDDRADIASLLSVAGLHVGQSDLSPVDARGIVGPEKWIGLSTHTQEQLLQADAEPEVDVIAVGPIFPTRGKESPDPVVGLELLRWARSRTGKPIVAIGGIEPANVGAVIAAGADAAAVIGAICRGGRGSIRTNALRLIAAAA